MMRTIQLAVACMAVLVATAGQVQAGTITIDFDAFTSTDSIVDGIVEDGIFIGDISGPIAVFGGPNGSGSGVNSIHHSGPGHASFSLTDTNGDTFTLGGFNIGGSFDSEGNFTWDGPLTLTGYLGTALIGTDTFSPGNPGSYYRFTPSINLAELTIDRLVFDMGTAVGSGIFIDDIELHVDDSGTVPEPASLAIFGIGACVMGFGTARRRRREKNQMATA